MAFFDSYFHSQGVAGLTAGTWRVKGRSSPQEPAHHSQALLTTGASRTGPLSAQRHPPLQQDRPRSRPSTLSSLSRAVFITCLETLEPEGLATLSLGLIGLPLPTPPPAAGGLRRELPTSAALTWNLAKACLGPQAPASGNTPGGSFKMHKCLRTNPQPPKPLFLPSWQDPYFSLYIFRDVVN